MGTVRVGAFRGSSDGKMTRSYDIVSLDKGDYSHLSLERLLIQENLSNEELCKLVELLCKYQERFVERPQKCNTFNNINCKCKVGCLSRVRVDQNHSH